MIKELHALFGVTEYFCATKIHFFESKTEINLSRKILSAGNDSKKYYCEAQPS